MRIAGPLIAGLALAFALLWGESYLTERGSERALARVDHPGGFSVAVPAGFSATRSGDGLVLAEDAALRAPRFLRLGGLGPSHGMSLKHCQDDPCIATGLDLFPIAARHVTENEGGSAGPGFDLVVVLIGPSQAIRIEASMQGELGPDFGFVDQVIRSIE
jgi:hypothetical protein